MSDALITTHAVGVTLSGQAILRNVSLMLEDSKIITLIGPNGAGKTTLIKVMLGLLPVTTGTVWRRPGVNIGYVPQRFHIDTNLPLRVERFLRLSTRSPRTMTRTVIAQVLTEVGAHSLIDHSLHALSGGELQRVLLARALLRQPQLLVLDEPMQGVDISGQTALYQLITNIRDRHHCTVLMVSHDLHLVMARTDTVVCLNRHICCQGSPAHISRDPAYLALFGAQYSDTLAVYQHHHDHQHDIRGDIVDDRPTTDQHTGNTCDDNP